MDIKQMLGFNEKFVQNGEHKPYESDKFPNKKIVILTCIDARLMDLLPRALNLKNGDAKIIRTAGGTITEPYGSIMKSLLVSIYALEADHVLVIGHKDCGMQNLEGKALVQKMIDAGVGKGQVKEDVAGWLTGFSDVGQAVLESVDLIKNHPLITKEINVDGFVIDPTTGKLEWLTER
ncbi:carbonic anhydrase [Bacillaceae bacterium S4-13-58]